MKRSLPIIFTLFISAVFVINTGRAQNPTYNLTAKNFIYTDSIGNYSRDAMTFDIVIEHVNLATSGPFEFAQGQYYFNIDASSGVTSADYTYYIVPGSTQFTNPSAIPRNPTIVNPDAFSPQGASLRVNSNTVLGAGNGPIVSTYTGTRVCTMRLKKKVGSMTSPFILNMSWRKALPNPYTKIFAYVGTTNTDISQSVPGVNEATVVGENGWYPLWPIADFTSDRTTIHSGDVINFTDLSSNSPTSWYWFFVHGTPDHSNLKNPTNIRFNQGGTFPVTLQVSNIYGGSSITHYITVLPADVQLLNPDNYSENNPTIINFLWNNRENSVRYQLLISYDSLFNNLFYDDSYISYTFITLAGFNYSTTYYWKVNSFDINNNMFSSDIWNFKIQDLQALKLNLTSIVEGMYYPLFNQLSRRDTVTVELRQNVSPYNLVASKKGIIDSLNYSALFEYPFTPVGTYYIVFKHLNSISTWSKAGGTAFNYTDTVKYNFTTSSSQAYGNNLRLKGGKYCILSGDVNQSGFVDATDMSIVDNASFISQTGRFIPADLNCDNIVDAGDLTIVDNNGDGTVGVIKP